LAFVGLALPPAPESDSSSEEEEEVSGRKRVKKKEGAAVSLHTMTAAVDWSLIESSASVEGSLASASDSIFH
jgi:hypothetical protein